jgi:hypothetical protein
MTTAPFIAIGNHKKKEVIRDETEQLLKLQNVTFQMDIIFI